MTSLLNASEGENREFGVAILGEEVTIHIHQIDGGTNTSADDTATDKYFDARLDSIIPSGYPEARAFQLRSDQTIQIISINGKTFTDPITVTINKGYSERYDFPIIWKMKIRTTVANTNVKLRVI